MKPVHIKERRRKEVRQVWKDIRANWDEQKALGYKKLAQPIRHGWYKEIVITTNVERYKNEQYILEVFEKIEKLYWGRNKKECEKHWDNQTSKAMIYLNFPTISKKQYGKLSKKAQKLCTSFNYREHKKWRTRYYIKIPKNAYKIKYTRAYNTHVKVIDPCLISEESLLWHKLEKKGYYEANIGLEYGYKYINELLKKRKDRHLSNQQLARFKNTSSRSIIDTLWERN